MEQVSHAAVTLATAKQQSGISHVPTSKRKKQVAVAAFSCAPQPEREEGELNCVSGLPFFTMSANQAKLRAAEGVGKEGEWTGSRKAVITRLAFLCMI